MTDNSYLTNSLQNSRRANFEYGVDNTVLAMFGWLFNRPDIPKDIGQKIKILKIERKYLPVHSLNVSYTAEYSADISYDKREHYIGLNANNERVEKTERVRAWERRHGRFNEDVFLTYWDTNSKAYLRNIYASNLENFKICEYDEDEEKSLEDYIKNQLVEAIPADGTTYDTSYLDESMYVFPSVYYDVISPESTDGERREIERLANAHAKLKLQQKNMPQQIRDEIIDIIDYRVSRYTKLMPINIVQYQYDKYVYIIVERGDCCEENNPDKKIGGKVRMIKCAGTYPKTARKYNFVNNSWRKIGRLVFGILTIASIISIFVGLGPVGILFTLFSIAGLAYAFDSAKKNKEKANEEFGRVCRNISAFITGGIQTSKNVVYSATIPAAENNRPGQIQQRQAESNTAYTQIIENRKKPGWLVLTVIMIIITFAGIMLSITGFNSIQSTALSIDLAMRVSSSILVTLIPLLMTIFTFKKYENKPKKKKTKK